MRRLLLVAGCLTLLACGGGTGGTTPVGTIGDGGTAAPGTVGVGAEIDLAGTPRARPQATMGALEVVT